MLTIGPLLDSFESADCGLLGEWLNNGGNPDEQDSRGKSLLHTASYSDNLEAVQLLVKASAHVDLPSANGSTPLHEAVLGGSERAARLLLQAGASPDAQMANGARPIHLALMHGSDKIVRLLVEATCASVECLEPTMTGGVSPPTPLFLSVLLGQHDSAAALIAAGEDTNFRFVGHAPDATDKFLPAEMQINSNQRALLSGTEGSLIAAASLMNDSTMVELLLKAATDPDPPESSKRPPKLPSALQIASVLRDLQIVSQLIKTGANVNIKDKTGFTPLHYAAWRHNNPKVISELIKAGSNVSAISCKPASYRCSETGFGISSPISQLAEAKADAHLPRENEWLSLQVSAKSDSSEAYHVLATAKEYLSTANGSTPLHLAVRSHCISNAAILLQSGANLDAQDSDGCTPLHLAVSRRNEELVVLLLSAGSSVDIWARNGVTPLVLAVRVFDCNIANLLVQAGARADPASNGNHDLLSWAVQFRQLEFAQILIDGGAQIDCGIGFGGFYMASTTDNISAVRLLINAGVWIDQRAAPKNPANILLCTAWNKKQNSVDALVKAGANTNDLMGLDLEDWQEIFCELKDAFRNEVTELKAKNSLQLDRLQLCQTMKDAGFKQANAAVQSGAAAVLEDILRDLVRNQSIFIFGSFADGWGCCLETMNGEISRDSDIDVTVMQFDRKLCLIFDSSEQCDCYGTQKVRYENGHVKYPFGATGPNAALTQWSSGRQHSIDRIFALSCCGYPRIELLQPHYTNRKGLPSCMPQRIMQLLREEVEGDSPRCHAVAASPPGREGQFMRVSTTLLERSVMHNLTTVQGQFFILIKFLIKKEISSRVSGLKTYMAKNLLFYMLDETPAEDWKQENLLELVQRSLQMLVEMMLSSDSESVCMKHFFLRDANVYFRREMDSKIKIINESVNQLEKCQLVESLLKYQNSLRPNPGNKMKFFPFELALIIVNPEPVHRYSGHYSSIYGLVKQCLLTLGSDLQGKSKAEHLADLLRLIGELPDCARTARESLRAMAHLKVGRPAPPIQKREKSDGRIKFQADDSWLLPVDEAERHVWRQLKETDSALVFGFEIEKTLNFNFLPKCSPGFSTYIRLNGMPWLFRIYFKKLHRSIYHCSNSYSSHELNAANLQPASSISTSFEQFFKTLAERTTLSKASTVKLLRKLPPDFPPQIEQLLQEHFLDEVSERCCTGIVGAARAVCLNNGMQLWRSYRRTLHDPAEELQWAVDVFRIFCQVPRFRRSLRKVALESVLQCFSAAASRILHELLVLLIVLYLIFVLYSALLYATL